VDLIHQPYITTYKGGSGWFAVQIHWNPDMGGFEEINQTGVGRYATKEEAEDEGKQWAKSEGLEFR
jgi:hypothetical protein